MIGRLAQRCGLCRQWKGKAPEKEGVELRWGSCQKFDREMSNEGHCAKWEQLEK